MDLDVETMNDYSLLFEKTKYLMNKEKRLAFIEKLKKENVSLKMLNNINEIKNILVENEFKLESK
uniref:Uncharacterized protein n=1 Tax=Meloidogyne enterolobii TaxID=390850 RepID=A0A6V7UXL7_MELEN|nr:unnamed protein product [Meloidogyne enterolobii]